VIKRKQKILLPKFYQKKEINEPKLKEEKNSKFTNYDSTDKEEAITKKLNTSHSSSEESPKNTKIPHKKLPKKEKTENPKLTKENSSKDPKPQKLTTNPEIKKKKILQEIVPPQQPRSKSPIPQSKSKKRPLPPHKGKKSAVRSKYDFLSNSESSSSENDEKILESDNDRKSGSASESGEREPEERPYAFLASLRSNNVQNKRNKKIPNYEEDRLRRHVRYNVPILKKGEFEQLDYYKGKKYI